MLGDIRSSSPACEAAAVYVAVARSNATVASSTRRLVSPSGSTTPTTTMVSPACVKDVDTYGRACTQLLDRDSFGDRFVPEHRDGQLASAEERQTVDLAAAAAVHVEVLAGTLVDLGACARWRDDDLLEEHPERSVVIEGERQRQPSGTRRPELTGPLGAHPTDLAARVAETEIDQAIGQVVRGQQRPFQRGASRNDRILSVVVRRIVDGPFLVGVGPRATGLRRGRPRRHYTPPTTATRTTRAKVRLMLPAFIAAT